MFSSPQVDQIMPALVNLQAALPAMHKDSENPHFRSAYTSFESILAEVLRHTPELGLFVTQGVTEADDGGSSIETRLYHVSGQWIANAVRMPLEKPTAQSAGSALTYGKRYGLAAILGVRCGDEDDDGNAATASNLGKERPKPMSNVVPPLTKAIERVAAMGETKRQGPGSVGGIPNSCPKCGGKVWSNVAKKASGEFKASSPDWQCADKSCKTGKFRTGGWIDDSVKVGPGEAGGPGMPGGSFDELPEALRDEDWERV